VKRFEGKEVLSSGIEIPNAAGGLRAALRIHPQEFHHGERRWVVLEVVVGKVRFDPVPKTSGLERVHVFAAEAATFVDQEAVQPYLDEQATALEEAERLAAEEAAGVQQLAGVRESAPRRRGRSVAAVDDLDGEG